MGITLIRDNIRRAMQGRAILTSPYPSPIRGGNPKPTAERQRNLAPPLVGREEVGPA